MTRDARARWVAGALGLGLLLAPTAASAADLVVPLGESSTRSGDLLFETIQISGTLNVKAYDGTPESGWLYLRARRIVIDATGIVTAKGRGYTLDLTGMAGTSPGEGVGDSARDTGEALPGGGGGHFGLGGTGRDTNCDPVTTGGIVTETDPANPEAFIFQTPEARQLGMGSAGGASWAGPQNRRVQRAGSNGGGVVILEAAQIEIAGTIDVDGAALGASLQNTGPGGGAGGTIVIRSNDLTLDTSARLTARGAKGGDTGASIGGGGGGGLISIFAPGDLTGPLATQVDVAGGALGVCMMSSPDGEPGAAAHFTDLDCIDADRDGAASAICGGTDCNDGDPAIGPGAGEICNGVDDDCNGVVDDESSPELCPPGSGLVCVEGACVEDPSATTSAGGGAPLAVPEVELGGGLCSAGRGAGALGPWALLGLLFAGGLGRRLRRR